MNVQSKPTASFGFVPREGRHDKRSSRHGSQQNLDAAFMADNGPRFISRRWRHKHIART